MSDKNKIVSEIDHNGSEPANPKRRGWLRFAGIASLGALGGMVLAPKTAKAERVSLTDLQAQVEALQTETEFLKKLINAANSESGIFNNIYIGVSTTTPQALSTPFGSVPNGFSGVFQAAVVGTSASASSIWHVTSRGGSNFIERMASHGSTSSNTPEIYDDGGTVSLRLFNSSVTYTVAVRGIGITSLYI